MDRRHVFVSLVSISAVVFCGIVHFMNVNTYPHVVPTNVINSLRSGTAGQFYVDPEPMTEICCSRWEPERSLYPNQHNSGVATSNSKSSPTDHAKSVVILLNWKQHFRICDRVFIRIEARDAHGRRKTYGGDYFRTKLYTPKPYSAVGPDFFFDYDNGTYLALFTLRWAGVVRVRVQLVHPSEAVRVLRQSDQRRVPYFGGVFTNLVDGKKYAENVTCGITPFKAPMCNLSSNHTHGPWYCEKPKNHRLSCSNWTHSFMNRGSVRRMESFLTKAEKDTFKRSKVELNTGKMFLKVDPFSQSKASNQSLCSYTPVPRTVKNGGFYLNGAWQRCDCGLRNYDESLIRSCLSERVIHFYGDSTARQMYTYLKASSGCKETRDTPRLLCQSDNHSSIDFKFHALPYKAAGVLFPVDRFRYLTDEIDSLQGGPGEVILLSVWAHFGGLDGKNGTFYKDRLLAIRGAVERLWERSPETRVIVRSANTRYHLVGGYMLITSDWIALQGEETLMDVFSGDERFSFLDAWDMTLVQESSDNVHPAESTLVQIMNYFLTIICTPSET